MSSRPQNIAIRVYCVALGIAGLFFSGLLVGMFSHSQSGAVNTLYTLVGTIVTVLGTWCLVIIFEKRNHFLTRARNDLIAGCKSLFISLPATYLCMLTWLLIEYFPTISSNGLLSYLGSAFGLALAGLLLSFGNGLLLVSIILGVIAGIMTRRLCSKFYTN